MNDDSLKEKQAKQAAMLANVYPNGVDYRGIQHRDETKEEAAAMYAGMVNVARPKSEEMANGGELQSKPDPSGGKFVLRGR